MDSNLKVQFNSDGYTFRGNELQKMDEALHTLRKALVEFPVAELRVDVQLHARSGDFHVRTNLRLPKRTLSTGERNQLLHYAYERCVSKLLNKLDAYKRQLKNEPAYANEQAGQVQRIEPDSPPDAAALNKAIDEKDLSVALQWDSFYEPLRSDPRFAGLLRRMKLT